MVIFKYTVVIVDHDCRFKFTLIFDCIQKIGALGVLLNMIEYLKRIKDE